VVNNLIYDNTVPVVWPNNASGIVTGSAPEFYAHNTIVGNTGGSASVVILSTNVTFTNSIVWGSVSDWDKIREQASYCVIQGGVDFAQRESHNHNFGNDPLFVDAGAYDFQVAAASLAIDSGTNVGVTQDFSGVVSRPQGAGFDIGAYERIQ